MHLLARKTALICVLTALSATFVVACAPARQGQGGSPAAVPASGPSSQLGTLDGGGGDTDRPSFDEIRAAVARLVKGKFYEQALAMEARSYKNRTGKVYVDLPISISQDPELILMLDDLVGDLAIRGDTSHQKWNFDFRESGSCISPEGERAAATKINDLTAPICLSLPRIQMMTRRADLEYAMAALILHELSHQHGANEQLAKKVERYMSLREVQNIESMLALSRMVALNRVVFRQLEDALDWAKKDLRLLSSVAVAGTESSGLLLSHLRAVRIDEHEKRVKVREAFENLDAKLIAIKATSRSEEVSLTVVKEQIDLAKQAFDVATQELRKSTGLNVVNFADVLCAYEKPELCDGM